MNDNETYEFETRRYVDPTLSSGEQEQFISNLRDAQAQNNQEIAEQTYNLGTDVPSNLGGLGGGEAYFTSRYQTPQVNEMVSTLKSAAQAEALNEVMNNYKDQLQNRYKQAYRAYQKRERKRRKAALTPAPTPAPTTPKKGGNVKTVSTEKGAGLKVGRDDLALSNFEHKSRIQQQQDWVNKTAEEMKAKEQKQRVNAAANSSPYTADPMTTAVRGVAIGSSIIKKLLGVQ